MAENVSMASLVETPWVGMAEDAPSGCFDSALIPALRDSRSAQHDRLEGW